MNNPYSNGLPIDINELPSRKYLLTEAVSRIVYGGSIAIISSPRLAKTSLLKYLADTKNRSQLYGEYSEKIIFNLIDCQMLPTQLTMGKFWEVAFQPLWEAYPDEQSINDALQQCKMEQFDVFSVEKLVGAIRNSGINFVLMLDEFDYLVAHPDIGKWNFFGALRFLLSHGGLTGIVACRQPLHKLEGIVSQTSSGSPFFNLFFTIQVPPFSEEDMRILLEPFGDQLTEIDRTFILSASGGHLFLFQTAASAIWDTFSSKYDDAEKRRLTAGKQIYRESQHYFSDLWRGWSNDVRKAITSVALLQAPYILKNRDINVRDLSKNLPNYFPELQELTYQGILAQDANTPGGFKILQGALLWWMADELIRTVRDDEQFNEWLTNRQLVGGVFTKDEIGVLAKSAKFIGQLLEKGSITLIEAYAKGLIQ